MYFYHLNWIQHSGYAAAMPLCGSAGSMGEWYRFLTTAIPCYCIFLEDVTCVSCIKYLYIYVHVYIYTSYAYTYTCTCTYCPIQYIFDDYHTWIISIILGLESIKRHCFSSCFERAQNWKQEKCVANTSSFWQQCLCRIYEVLHPVLSAGNSWRQNVPSDNVWHQWITMSLPIFSIHGKM